MPNNRFAKDLFASVVFCATLAACSSDEFSADPDVAAQQVDEKVDAEAKTLEEAADEAMKIKQAEIDNDTDTIITDMNGGTEQ
ncbi:hypothetical protein [Sphingorhabdus sp. Alg239-R122]|uniref:hypothetical protein n=1 Tax=Sphingorhabdus sp. Alg239-R122 TaxID=2305989 RepID=UPI0013D957C5|nr:hypothetical protein [Sphingorhabdus sp. Alg239-R122]